MPISNHKKLNFIIRKNKGVHKLKQYKQFFINLNLEDLEYIDLEQSDDITGSISDIFPFIVPDYEIIEGNSEIKDSRLLTEILYSSNNDDFCYIFIDDVDECGMFKAKTISALNHCLSATKLSFEKTFFLTDSAFKFSFRINYYNEECTGDKDKFDIQRQMQEKKLKNEFKI